MLQGFVGEVLRQELRDSGALELCEKFPAECMMVQHF